MKIIKVQSAVKQDYFMLGPFLFLVFINDLSQVISDGYNTILADDECLYTIGKSVREVHVKMLYRIISMNLATLSRSWSFLNQNELSKIYKTKVQPSIDYCNEYSKNMIFRLQKELHE